MPSNCSRCSQFIAKGEETVLDLEEYHQECAIEEIEEQVHDIPESKKEQLREKVRKASELQFSRRRGLRVIQ